jgi:murein DD-endopeptidase MepM/ murein hydrolase activator NlpD
MAMIPSDNIAAGGAVEGQVDRFESSISESGLQVVSKRLSAITVALGVALGSAACATSGVHHVVAPGENLYRIGKAYGVSHDELARINRLRAPFTLEVGDELYIPDADRQLPVSVITPKGVSAEPPPHAGVSGPHGAPGGRQVPGRGEITRLPGPSTVPVILGPAASRDTRIGRTGFSWPIAGQLSSSFGKRARGHHDGIDIRAPKGSAIYAARDGKVIFSDRLSSYGNVVIVEHGSGYATVYAHNDANLVRKGARVRRGERIATVGDTGRARGPHLHFEVRKGNIARNPLYYLPGSTAVAAAR